MNYKDIPQANQNEEASEDSGKMEAVEWVYS
jgi:hypothetical protein